MSTEYCGVGGTDQPRTCSCPIGFPLRPYVTTLLFRYKLHNAVRSIWTISEPSDVQIAALPKNGNTGQKVRLILHPNLAEMYEALGKIQLSVSLGHYITYFKTTTNSARKNQTELTYLFSLYYNGRTFEKVPDVS